MFKITANVDGKEVPLEKLGETLKEKLLASVIEQVTEKLAAVTCPIHGTHATVTVRGLEGTQLKFDIAGCCDKLVEACNHAIHG